MYQHIIPTRIIFSVGIGLLIFSLVFGWVAFSVPDWLQFYEHNGLKSNISSDDNFNDLKKFGLWYKCVFLINSNDFICTLWNNDAPSFVRVAQVLISLGLSFGCLAFLTACFAFICRRGFITTVLFAGLFAFLSFVFITIGVTVFATESLVYVGRLRIINNENPRRWGMWLLIPNLILSFLTSICFFLASIFNWCDYRSMKVTGILSHSVEKYNGSVCKLPSESNITSALKKQYQYQDYPTACYQLNGLNNNQQNPINYPPPPSYPGPGGYQTTPPGLFGYSRPGSPTMNPMYPHSNFDSYHPRHYVTENSEMDDLPRMSRSRCRSRRYSSHRSRSYSPHESPTITDTKQKQTQFIPISVPYYQPQAQQSQPASIMPTNNNSQPISYIVPQAKQQFIEENNQSTLKPINMLKYGNTQPSVLVSNNPTQPVYTIAYRPNNGGNVLTSNILSGPAATTYVTATRNQIAEINSLNSDSETEDRGYQIGSKRQNLKKINIKQAWAWRKMQ